MKRLAFACACGAILICAAPQVHAQIGPKGRPQPPFPGATPGSRFDAPDQNDNRDRRFGPANHPHPVHVLMPHFHPGLAEPYMPPVNRSFKAPPVAEFHPPVRLGGGAGKVGGRVLAAIGAALAGAFGALFGFRRKKGNNG